LHKISVLLLAILLISLTGCEDKKQNDSAIPVENTTQVLQQSNTDTKDHSAFKIKKIHTPATKVSKTKTHPIQNFHLPSPIKQVKNILLPYIIKK